MLRLPDELAEEIEVAAESMLVSTTGQWDEVTDEELDKKLTLCLGYLVGYDQVGMFNLLSNETALNTFKNLCVTISVLNTVQIGRIFGDSEDKNP